MDLNGLGPTVGRALSLTSTRLSFELGLGTERKFGSPLPKKSFLILHQIVLGKPRQLRVVLAGDLPASQCLALFYTMSLQDKKQTIPTSLNQPLPTPAGQFVFACLA